MVSLKWHSGASNHFEDIFFFQKSQYSLFHKGFPEFQSRICIRVAGYISMESLLPAKSAPQISPATANWHEGEHNAGETEDTNKESVNKQIINT